MSLVLGNYNSNLLLGVQQAPSSLSITSHAAKMAEKQRESDGPDHAGGKKKWSVSNSPYFHAYEPPPHAAPFWRIYFTTSVMLNFHSLPPYFMLATTAYKKRKG